MIHIFKIIDPKFSTFKALRRRLSQVIGENSVYPIVKATKFTANVQYTPNSTYCVTTRHDTLSSPCVLIQEKVVRALS